MGISFKLAIKYLNKNKKRTIATIIGITIVVILLISILSLFNVYQEYMICMQRQDENWEARFNNINYEKVYGLKNNTDIQDVSLIHEIGISETIKQKNNTVEEHIYLKAYNQTAINNLGIKLIKGRLPQNEKEIVISQNYISKNIVEEIGNSIELTINNTTHKYEIVGIIKPPKFEKYSFKIQYIGAITYLEENSLLKDDIVETSVNYKNLKDVYSKSEEIVQVLKLYDNESESKSNLEYNTKLLHYSGILSMTNEEDLKIIGIMLFFIILTITIAITFIYSIFNISILERKREFANLNSLGATRGQIFSIIIQEGTILLVISILIGIVFSIFILNGIVEYVNSITSQISIELAKNIPYGKVLIAILLTTIITYIAILRPAKKASKISIIQVLKGEISKEKIDNRILNKKVKTIEKKLAIRNMCQYKSKYNMVIFTMTISIFLFLTTQGYIKNTYRGMEKVPDNYSVSLYNLELLEEIKQEFLETNTINSMSIYNEIQLFTFIDDLQINESLQTVIKENPEFKERLFIALENEFQIKLLAIPDNEYDKYLEELGLKQLNDGECIFINYDPVKTKYYNGVHITNYKKGDNIDIYLYSKKAGYAEINKDKENPLKDIEFIEYGDNQPKVNLKIAKIVEDLPQSMKMTFSNEITPSIYAIVNYDTLVKTKLKLLNIDEEKEEYRVDTTLSINTSNRELLDEKLKQIGLKHQIEDYELADTMYIDTENKVEEKRITQIFLYSITVLIALVTLINIMNVVIKDINLRLRDFSILKSIGMTNKQFNKMIFLEYFSYLGKSSILGIILSLIITYIIYLLTEDYMFYNFQIPYIEIGVVLVCFGIILVGIIKYINKKLRRNITHLIKEEK